jgi:hypothetical protein
MICINYYLKFNLLKLQMVAKCLHILLSNIINRNKLKIIKYCYNSCVIS